MKKKLSLFLAAIMLFSALTACGSTPEATGSASADGASTSAPGESGDSGSAAASSEIDLSQKEAPMLAALVESGDLPPVEERLPTGGDAMVEPDMQGLGAYGGAITITANDNGRWSWGPWTEQSMFRFKQDGSGEVEPNVCKEFYPNDDSTVWTIKLREGMRWSDGAPFTADDVIFYYDHMSTPALNEDRTVVDEDDPAYYSTYTSSPYACYRVEVDGEAYWAEFAKVNDYEFTVTFAAPNPAFPVNVAVDNKWMFVPKHFYVNYVARKDGVEDDADFPLITEEQALENANRDFGKQWDTYSTMARDIGYYNWDYAVIPQLRSFVAVKDNWNVVGETYRLERNPYFWKTDDEGRQLPYLDAIEVKIINELDQKTLAASSGEFDWYDVAQEYSTVVSNVQDTHDVVVWSSVSWSVSGETLQLNQTVKDPDKRALFQDIRFREALSISVDRNLLNETLRNGVSRPWQASINSNMPGHDPEWSSTWIDLDIDRANTLLDEITEPWDGTPDTYRKMKGTNNDVEIIVSIGDPSTSSSFFSILQTSYKEIGVKLSDKVDADFKTTMLSNDVEAAFEGIGGVTPAIRPDALVPVRNVQFWHSAYGKWYEDGKTEAFGGIEPTGDVMALVEAYDEMKAASGPDRDQVVAQCVQKIHDLHKKNIWAIGFLEPTPNRNIKSHRLQNVPEGMIWADEYRFASVARPEQWWVAD